MSVGQDLLNVPFPEMVQNLAFAIAKGQLALDRSSMETARFLAREKVKIIEEISEVIEPNIYQLHYDKFDDQGNSTGTGTILVTGAQVITTIPDPVDMTLLQAGLMPTFYQFTETLIEVKMAISSKTTSSSQLDVGLQVEAGANWGVAHVTVTAHVNFKTSNTYSYSAEGSSLLRTTLKPVPPPARLVPRTITVNTLPLLQGQPAIVTTV